MNIYTLTYHDIVELNKHDSTGIIGLCAAIYKVSPEIFEAHLDSIAERIKIPPLTVFNMNDARRHDNVWMITFDDGGRGAIIHAARILESRGFIGHFFITTDFIDNPGFVTKDEIRDLRSRGHIIGSHSCSHPRMMSSLSHEEMLREWKDSLSELSTILDEPVHIASLPGGYYSRKVAVAAAEAGIKYLFTSEPTSRQKQVNGCQVIGRYSIKTNTLPSIASDLACGRLTPRWQQWAYWNVKKTAKLVLAGYYLSLRRSLLKLLGCYF